MREAAWVKEFPAAITVCDATGIILEMNDRSRDTFAADGGGALIGRSLYDCHEGTAREKLSALLASESPNCYTIEKAGKKKLIYQAPWFQEGTCRGFVEFSIPIPDSLPHFIRK